MRIKKQSSWDSFNIEGLTFGKLLAMKHVFEFKQGTDSLSPVQQDILVALTKAIDLYDNSQKTWNK